MMKIADFHSKFIYSYRFICTLKCLRKASQDKWEFIPWYLNETCHGMIIILTSLWPMNTNTNWQLRKSIQNYFLLDLKSIKNSTKQTLNFNSRINISNQNTFEHGWCISSWFHFHFDLNEDFICKFQRRDVHIWRLQAVNLLNSFIKKKLLDKQQTRSTQCCNTDKRDCLYNRN